MPLYLTSKEIAPHCGEALRKSFRMLDNSLSTSRTEATPLAATILPEKSSDPQWIRLLFSKYNKFVECLLSPVCQGTWHTKIKDSWEPAHGLAFFEKIMGNKPVHLFAFWGSASFSGTPSGKRTVYVLILSIKLCSFKQFRVVSLRSTGAVYINVNYVWPNTVCQT